METTRRSFLKQSAFIAAAATVPGSLFAEVKHLQRIVLQLYSVRDEMHADAKGTLKKLAALNYTHVEHAGYNDRRFYGFTVKDFKLILDDLGLKMPSGHTVMARLHWDNAANDFTDLWKYTVEDAAAVGQRYVISPGLGFGAQMTDEYMKPFMDQFNKCGELCKKYGMKFGYHNHDFEFTAKVGNTLFYDYMLQNTDATLVTQQLDVGNMYIAGAQALDYLAKYPGRFELMHVKDMLKISAPGDAKPKFESCVLGKGELPLKKILKAAKRSGTTQLVIEQEEYQDLGQVESAGIDLQVMKSWKY